MTNIATKGLLKERGADRLESSSTTSLDPRIISEGPVLVSPRPPAVENLARLASAKTGTMTCDVACGICPAFNLLCAGTQESEALGDGLAGQLQLSATVH